MFLNGDIDKLRRLKFKKGLESHMKKVMADMKFSPFPTFKDSRKIGRNCTLLVPLLCTCKMPIHWDREN